MRTENSPRLPSPGRKRLGLALVFFLAAPAAGQARFTLEGNELKVPGPVLFETGSDKLKAESGATLDHVAAYLADKTYISLMRVEAHSDPAPGSQALTERRALSVAHALVGRGVDCKRLLPVGFGETKPVAPNSSPEGRAQNRRVSFINAALRGRPIGGMPVDGGGKVAGDPCK